MKEAQVVFEWGKNLQQGLNDTVSRDGQVGRGIPGHLVFLDSTIHEAVAGIML